MKLSDVKYYPSRRKTKVVKRFTRLNLSLLAIFLATRKKELELDDIIKDTYQNAGKPLPQNARQAMAGLIRDTSSKINHLNAAIERVSKLGRQNKGAYSLTGNRDAIKEILKEKLG